MKLTRQQHILLGVLGLAGASFAGDRLLLGGGQSARPAESARAASPAPAPQEAPTPKAAARPAAQASSASISKSALASSDGGPLVVPTLSLTQRLERLNQPAAGLGVLATDGFSHPVGWVKPQGAPVLDAAPEQGVRPASDFKLSMILLPAEGSLRGPVAAINGLVVAAGQKVLGYEVVSVDESGAVLSHGGDRIELPAPRRTDLRESENRVVVSAHGS